MADEKTFEAGFSDFSDLLKSYVDVVDNIMDEEEKIAEDFVQDLLKLPKPKSAISKPGYTHMVDSFTYRRKDEEIEVGWGKYYCPMVENGTRKMRAQPHLKPLWNQNQDKYIKAFKERNNLE